MLGKRDSTVKSKSGEERMEKLSSFCDFQILSIEPLFLNPVSRDQDKCVAYIFNFLSTIVTEIFIEKREKR